MYATNEQRISRSTLTAGHPRYRCGMVCKSSLPQYCRGYLAYMLAERMESPWKVRARIFRMWFALYDGIAAESVSTSANVIYSTWRTPPFCYWNVVRLRKLCRLRDDETISFLFDLGLYKRRLGCTLHPAKKNIGFLTNHTPNSIDTIENPHPVSMKKNSN